MRQKPNAITLSIGDGANDVNMITEAHVGVGIQGLEGQQAARSADFSIGEFRHLKRLLFFHGRESYRKNSLLILYNFYKNMLLCMPQFWFGVENWYAGQTLYEAINYQLFNVFYTSVPIILFALFDKQTTDLVLESDPSYYEAGPKRKLFGTSRFLKWFAWASSQAFVMMYSACMLFDFKFSNSDGDSYGFWPMGHMIFFGVVFIANMKIFTFSNSISIGLIFTASVSVSLFLALWIYLNGQVSEIQSTFGRMWGNIHAWVFMIILLSLVAIDYGLYKIYDITVFASLIPPTTMEKITPAKSPQSEPSQQDIKFDTYNTPKDDGGVQPRSSQLQRQTRQERSYSKIFIEAVTGEMSTEGAARLSSIRRRHTQGNTGDKYQQLGGVNIRD